MSEFKHVIGMAGYVIEAVGVLVIIIGCAVSSFRFLINLRRPRFTAAYREYRRILGRSIILGLEFLIAGDIIRTVVVSHTLANVGALALIVLIRAFLSLTLELGIEGRLPWKQHQGEGA